ncbi:putative TetR-family transcriptional regulator [Actinoplanes missouriensis 431]|uniref:Putative TetR-family transcriptional regulator n=1 Tax=Actinoplanes missouriensis (strain ATCC 14538 / DSM 43046 / CBS 188.64 / JCM 3121 / NBRC 102363 / NCIMB 12654 / NRRL B-3342 / UNCC 431) TaxID=512565 RepID=I0HBK1_ACTM4|nr:TetR/AcrR family transcriptional regulator [Actinoplanes missouriensis]BAL90388.1 putative TetR-family transcriptional regulator [Actinoplanes missouriensis 431]
MTTPVRRRDAAATRKALLDAARRRFAADGYASTSVRDIASDAGVNVALISRYFESKEGLFRACLRGTVDEIKQSVLENLPLTDPPRQIAEKLAGPQTKEPHRLQLLLRTSGDETAERIRRETLESISRRVATAAGADPDDPGVLLNAQVVLSAALGVLILRSAALQPLAAADQDQLTEPLRVMIAALLPG